MEYFQNKKYVPNEYCMNYSEIIILYRASGWFYKKSQKAALASHFLQLWDSTLWALDKGPWDFLKP